VILQVDVPLFSKRLDVTVIQHAVLRMSTHRTNINICGIYTPIFKKRVWEKAFTSSVKEFSRHSPGWNRESRNVTGFCAGFDAGCVEWHNEVRFFSVRCQLKQGTGIVSKTFSIQGN